MLLSFFKKETTVNKQATDLAVQALMLTLYQRNAIEFLKGIRLLFTHGLNACVNALVANKITHQRSEIASLQDHILPNVGMSEEVFFKWLAMSDFGRAVSAVMERPLMPFKDYKDMVVEYYQRVHAKKGEILLTPVWTADTELHLKRVACGVLLQLRQTYGSAHFYEDSENGKTLALFTPAVLDNIRKFSEGQMGEALFFGRGSLFTPSNFYNELIEYAGLLIDTKVN